MLLEQFEDRFQEILSCPGLKTIAEREQFFDNIPELKKRSLMLKKKFGVAATLALELLLQSGVVQNPDFRYFGQKLDILLYRVVNLPQIQILLEKRHLEDSFETQFILLATLRDRLFVHLPHRVQDETVIRLTNMLEEDWETSRDIRGSEILFTAFDYIVLSKFGFNINCVVSGDNLLLEIITPERTIYWEPLTNAPISCNEVTLKYSSDFLFLIGSIFSKIADAHILLGRELEKAIEFYRKAIDIASEFPDFYIRLAQSYIKTSNPKQARINIQKAIDIDHNSAEYYHLLGIANCITNDWQAAINAIKSATALKPNYLDALNNLAYCYEQNQELDKALEVYQQVIAYRPNYFEANYGLGNVHFGLKQYDRALTYFERALKIDPKSKQVLYNIAQTYYEKGDFNKSIKVYKELLRLEPNHAFAWYNLGIIYRNKEKKKEAVKCIEQAVRLNPNLMK